MCIVFICLQVCDINFEINLSFLIKPFSYMSKNSGQKLNILRTKRVFNMKLKRFFIIFKGIRPKMESLNKKIKPSYLRLYDRNYGVFIASRWLQW